MKFLKYISICLLAVLFASCDKKDIEFPMEDVSNKAQIQVAYMCLMQAMAAN